MPFSNRIIVKHPDSEGGLAFIWKNGVLMEVINFIANHVLAKVIEDDGFTWFLTCFYGWSVVQEREKLWKLLAHLRTFVDGPWLYIIDFNAFLHASEKLRKQPLQTAQIDAFWDVLEPCQLEDLGFRGYPFTWSNKRLGDANTKVRLDRTITTKEWREKYQLSTITHLSSHILDHLPIVFQT